MEFINLPYLLLYLPLIFSVISILTPYKKLSISIVITSVLVQLSILVFLIPDLVVNESLSHKINDEILFLAGEYRITPGNLCFLFCTFLIELISLINYKQESEELELTENKKFFYAFYILNYFAISGIFLTNNIFNLYFYLEIYSFTLYALIANYRDTNSSVVAFSYYIGGVFGSIILLLFSFLIYIKFGTTDIDIIRASIPKILNKDLLSLASLLMLFLIGMISKFFSFWAYFSTIKKSIKVVSYLFISLMFIHVVIGSYLIINFFYYIVGTKIIFDIMHLEYALYFLGGAMIVYNSYKIMRTANLFFIVLSLCLISLGYVLIVLANSNNFSLESIVLFLMDHFSANLLLYFIVSFLIYNFQTVDIHYLKSLKSHSFIIYAIILSKLFIPIGSNFPAVWFYLNSVFESSNYFLLIPFFAEKIAVASILFKVRNVFLSNIEIEDFDLYEDPNNKRYLASMYLMFFLTIMLMFLSNKLPILLINSKY